MRTRLDPKLDIVFKLLFGEEQNRPLLLSLLNAVLRPPTTIETVTVLSSEPGKEGVDDKGVETHDVQLDIQPLAKKEGKAKPEAEEATAS